MFQQDAEGGGSLSGPVCAAASCRMTLAAKGACAAWVRRADQRARYAWVAAARKAWGAARLRALARRRRKVEASPLHRPPTSMARTTRRQRLPCTSSGYVRSLARRAAWRAGEVVGGRPGERGRPELVSVETNVVSTASCAPLCRGSPCARTSTRRLSRRLVATLRSDTRTWVATLDNYMVPRSFLWFPVVS